MERDGFRFEIVFVNDGSRDDTLARLLDRAALDQRLRIVNLSRNFGKEAALTAGIDHAKGDVIVPMDIEAVLTSAARTGQLVTVEEAPRRGGAVLQ